MPCAPATAAKINDLMKESSGEPDWPVKVIRSSQRRKTVGARLEDGVLVIRAPASISDKELTPIIEGLRKRMVRRARVVPQTDEMLEKRARELNRKYFGGR